MIYTYHHLKIYYQKYGNKKNTIVILPGWGNTRNTFQSIIEYFQNEYTIYIMDYPGFGNSPIPEQELTMDDYAILIKEFLKENKIENPIIIAHSFGGRITSLVVTKYQVKVKKIVLIDVAGIKRRKTLLKYLKEKIYKLLKSLTRLLPPIKQEKYRQKLLMYFASSDYQSIPKCMQKTFQNIIGKDLRNYYKKINTETLLIWGENDQDTPLKDGYYLRKIIKNSALIVYKGANHFSYLQYKELTNQIIQEFIKEKQV